MSNEEMLMQISFISRMRVRMPRVAMPVIHGRKSAAPARTTETAGNGETRLFFAKGVKTLLAAAGMAALMTAFAISPVSTPSAFAAPAKASPVKGVNGGGILRPDTSVPTKIQSERMTYDANKRTVVFSGSVHVARPDLEMWSDDLTIYLKPEKPKEEGKPGSAPAGMGAGEVERLVSSGHVRMKADTRTGTCERAEYDVDKGILVMTGDPFLKDGENTITGEVIRYYSNEQRSEVTSGSKRRVEAVFTGPAPSKPDKRKR